MLHKLYTIDTRGTAEAKGNRVESLVLDIIENRSFALF